MPKKSTIRVSRFSFEKQVKEAKSGSEVLSGDLADTKSWV